VETLLALPAWIRKGVALYSAPPDGCRETQHPTWRIKMREASQWGSGGRLGGRSLQHHQEYCSDIFGGCIQCLFSFVCLFVAGLIACRLFFHECCRPVTLRLWSGFLMWLLLMVPVAPSWMMWRFYRCPSK